MGVLGISVKPLLTSGHDLVEHVHLDGLGVTVGGQLLVEMPEGHPQSREEVVLDAVVAPA